jgi:hypothetical protein
MPTDMTRYPPNWKAFTYWVKHYRAQGRCECTGECGMHRPNPKPRRCVEQHGKPAHWFHGTVRLTTAHLCDCDPPCDNPAHVKATCQRCHLRIDRFRHAKAAAKTRNDPARKQRLRLRPQGEPPWPGSPPTRDYPPPASPATPTHAAPNSGSSSPSP